MSIEIIPYEKTHDAAWDELCRDSANATFLHTRRFLAYHGDRFRDVSVLVAEKGKLLGVFPAAESPRDKGLIVSHPGATFGGIVHQGGLRGARMVEALTALTSYYRAGGYHRMLYKLVPYIYAREPSQDDGYALFRLGARRVRCDLASTIDLSRRGTVSERRRRGVKKAMQEAVLSSDPGLMEALWTVLTENLARKHGVQPVHSLPEIRLLRDFFPGDIDLLCGLVEGKVEAGVVLFKSGLVWHAQYIAASERAYEVSALDLVFETAIANAQEAGVRYFDFGISTEDNGKMLNEGLFQFKTEFGSGSVAYEHYEIALNE